MHSIKTRSWTKYGLSSDKRYLTSGRNPGARGSKSWDPPRSNQYEKILRRRLPQNSGHTLGPEK